VERDPKMIDWKQSLYVFLLRRVLGPLLDASSAKKLHESIDFSLQEGKFILKNINLDAAYLTEQLSSKCPGLSVRRGSIDRLEINLTLRENHHESDNQNGAQSSLAWRAMKLGSFSESLPAVSLVAESKIDGIYLELDTIDFKDRKEKVPSDETTAGSIQRTSQESPKREEESTSKSIIGSYIEAALATLQLNLKLTNIHIKLCQKDRSDSREVWVALRVLSFSHNDLDVNSSTPKTVVNKAIEFSAIRVETGETIKPTNSSTNQSSSDRIPTQSTVALAEGNGQLFLRVCAFKDSHQKHNCSDQEGSYLQRDIEIRLNHQFNFSFDNRSLLIVQQILDGFNDITEAKNGSDEVSIFRQSSMMKNPHIVLGMNEINDAIADSGEVSDIDREDLKALTGIMRQYREAYHMIENNKMRGGILVPSNAYLDEKMCTEEADDESTFDVFFDANDQSFYNTMSLLTKSACHHRNEKSHGEDPDHIHTKLRINLLAASIKINFRHPDQKLKFSHTDEYILATINDVTLSLSSTQLTNEMLLDVTHIQIEDAHLTKSKHDIKHSTAKNLSAYGDAVQIGSILSWPENDSCSEVESLVSQAPCLSVLWKNTRNEMRDDTIFCKITLLPIELSLRQRTMANISNFANLAQNGASEFGRSKMHRMESDATENSRENDKEISLFCDCPSINLSFPFTEELAMSKMFERTSEIVNGRFTRESSIGVVFENTSFELNAQELKGGTPGQTCLSGNFSCLHMGLFATSPQSETGYDTRLLRKDLFIASGRLEVNPNIPISLGFMRPSRRTNQENLGRDSFPIVPAISSFKARQEDDDDDIKTGRSQFSKFDEVEKGARTEFRRTDPQIAMLENSEKSTIIFSTNIPELIIDLTSSELEVFVRMLNAMQQPQSNKLSTPQGSKRIAQKPSEAFPEKISVAVNLDKVSISIRDGGKVLESNQKNVQVTDCSFLLAMDNIKSHAFFLGSEMKHFRVFSHDFCLYYLNGTRSNSPNDRRQKLLEDRFQMVKNSIWAFLEVSTRPLLFRSQLFTPISQETPSILVDLVDLSPMGSTNNGELKQRRIYLTLYHLTHRYDTDSDWIDRFSNIVVSPLEQSEERPETSLESRRKSPHDSKCIENSMTRVFVSCADVNLDYKSPRYFGTVSKSIVRIGDLRLSCNMMKPLGPRQAYYLSIGDVTYHITSDVIDNQYRNENQLLCRHQMMTKEKKHFRGTKASLFGTLPEAILRELNFVNVLSLDTMDAIVIKRSDSSFSLRNLSRESPLAFTLTLGTVSIQGCKDSFTCFANSVGELNSKLTALTDEDVLRMKGASFDPIEPKTTKTDEKLCNSLEETKGQPFFSESKIPTITQMDSHTLLLDGYGWTTIDKDPLPRLVIPPGDEQISGWYNTHGNRPAQGFVMPEIIHQHFPHHSVADPLSDGDMGAKALIGDDRDLFQQMRLSVQKLNLKVRFFDGYDWPNKCSLQQREAVKRSGKAFVIEPFPRASYEVEKADRNRQGNASFAMKARLMGELLDTEDDNIFEEVPLPEDKVWMMNNEKFLRLSKRRSSVFFQISLNEVALRMESYTKSKSHRLQSILEVTISNLFLAETVSCCTPLKMIGEWSNDNQHPRDSRFGTLMLNMATWAPKSKITKDGEIASDECNVTVQLMPMRCLLDQRAISFMKAFFNNEESDTEETEVGPEHWSSGLHLLPPPFFKTFTIKPWKVKVDYYPIRVDVTALREGSIVELVNLSPIQRMVITLNEVVVEDLLGMGPVIDGIVSKWIQEICATQLHKFLANARPFEPFTDVGQGLTDLVVLPYEAFKEGDSIQRAMKKGMKSLAETVVFQTLATTSGLTKIAAGLMANYLGGGRGKNIATDPLPSRPLSIPKGIGDAQPHAARSLTRGFSAANYKVVVIPYREYLRNGVTGAVTSVIKGIPVLLVAPLTGATEAASYTLLGARNALRPDLRREEEEAVML